MFTNVKLSAIVEKWANKSDIVFTTISLTRRGDFNINVNFETVEENKIL